MKTFVIADEHYSHFNCLTYDGRPFETIEEMHEIFIQNHNKIVSSNDVTFHVGDFTLDPNPEHAQQIIRQLNGKHFFIKGSHDRWLPQNHTTRIEKRISKTEFVVFDHYQMTTWPRSHYGSFQFYGHSHGRSKPKGNQMEVFCGTFNWQPAELDELIEKIKQRPDYFKGIK